MIKCLTPLFLGEALSFLRKEKSRNGWLWLRLVRVGSNLGDYIF